MEFLTKFLGRKFTMGAVVLILLTLVFWFRGESSAFGRYADFCEMAFGIFTLGNILEHFTKRGQNAK